MRSKLLTVAALLFGLWLSLSSNRLNPTNPPTNKTGAPGETTCADSGCHSPAGTLTGSVSIGGVPDTVIANQTYLVTIKNESTAVRAGFEMTCWDDANAMCGTFTVVANSGVNIGSSGTKRYPRQSAPKNLVGGSTSWTVNWKAPATASGNKATFYFASLCANGNGQRTGDNVVTGKKTVVLAATTPAFEVASEAAVRLYPTLAKDFVQVDLHETAKGQLSIATLQGGVVLQSALLASNRIDIIHLAPGIYLAREETGGKMAVRKIVVRYA